MTTKGVQDVTEYLADGDSLEFILQTCFYHVPAQPDALLYWHKGKEVRGPVDEFWWRECTLDEWGGGSGYLMVWYRDGKITTFHTYRLPTDWAVG